MLNYPMGGISIWTQTLESRSVGLLHWMRLKYRRIQEKDIIILNPGAL